MTAVANGVPVARTLILTVTAMLAFAGNSVIARLALRGGDIDPASYTAIRLAAGALMLVAISAAKGRSRGLLRNSGWPSALWLFGYAVAFSYAYVTLSAGTGALILFGAVQGTMIIAGLLGGDRPVPLQWAGWVLACTGLTWLLSPGIEAPPLAGAALMAVSGIAWGFYSLRGRAEGDPLAANASSFALSMAPAVLLYVLATGTIELTPYGAGLAVLSGAVTSALGYILWYAALAGLTAMQAALVQLSVPAIAMAGGVLLLAEPLTLRLVLSSLMVLGGILMALWKRRAS